MIDETKEMYVKNVINLSNSSKPLLKIKNYCFVSGNVI